MNFLPGWQPARLIRTLSGIIKSLLSSQVDIWVLVASPPSSLLPPLQDEYRHKFTNLQSLDPRERTLDWFLQPSNPSEQSTQGGAELRHNLEKFLFPVFSVCKVDRKAPAFSCLETKGGFAKVGNLTVARKNKPRLSHCQQPGTFCSLVLVSVTRDGRVSG